MSEPHIFQPEPSLVDGTSQSTCRAIVILPIRNEQSTLPAALDALVAQVDTLGKPLPLHCFEVILLLNNCTDASAKVAHQWKTSHLKHKLHIVERTLTEEAAHVGTARRLLMDTAWHRLQNGSESSQAILSTDADTVASPDWIAQNLRAFADGADAVGGFICLKDGDLELLPSGARTAYLLDRQYQRLVAELEDLLDPQPGDPWPRHLQHFGASLACTPQIYARAGGMRPVRHLEDVAFVAALRLIDARLRHDPAVLVFTSARLDGRTEIGLSGQLRLWQQASDAQQEHFVECCSWLIHRFISLHHLRTLCETPSPRSWKDFPSEWGDRLEQASSLNLTGAQFLANIDCDHLIEQTFRGEKHQDIVSTNHQLRQALACIREELHPRLRPLPQDA